MALQLNLTKTAPVTSHALQALNDLINGGAEYPDAEHRVSFVFGVDADELRAAYDAQDGSAA